MPVQLDALQGRTFTGRITEIAASANRESRVFNIEVTLPNRDRSLKVGMIATHPYRASEYANCACGTTDRLDDRGIRFE